MDLPVPGGRAPGGRSYLLVGQARPPSTNAAGEAAAETSPAQLGLLGSDRQIAAHEELD